MRIQHNIMAMNAYRNYTGNVNAMKSNLEKLSSGYKINRAGDDAAGLAISEKMRAQITGLNAAQKNVKDGISLVQTAEGAMQEVQDMLNRMVYLATQSANGTYDDEVDRNNLQKELDQLRSEIDRISDSANFNGIKLLDGSKDAAASTTVNPTTFSGETTGVYIPNETDTAAGNVNTGGQGWGLYTHKDATGAAKTSFDVRLSNYEVTGMTAGDTAKITLGLKNRGQDTAAADNQIEVDVIANEDGKVTGEMIAKAIAEKLKTSGQNLTNGSGTAVNYNVTATGDTLTFEMSENGYKTAAAAYDDDQTTGASEVFNGNYNVEISAKDAADADLTTTGLTDAFTSVTKMGTAAAGTQLADGIVAPGNAGWGTGDFKDGSGIKIGDTAYVFATTDETMNAKFDSNTKVIDLRDLVDEATGGLKAGTADNALHRVADAAADNAMWSVQVNNNIDGPFLGVREKETYSGNADLTTVDGIKDTIQLFSKATASVTEKEAKGSALTFQIGDTAEDFNQLKVSIGDIHAKALGIDGISIKDQTSAQNAVQAIKDAINTVSSIRGDLGATQNRLEHTANNLSVMQENITDAESSIRDTDVAEEMMAYTKNNILIQAAQAMLAQANQIPQGVLQLLQ